MTIEIGKDIPWTVIIGHALHVLEFDRVGTKVEPSGKVKAKGFLKPYGYLLVESPILKQPARLPIVHRDDFLLADSVFDEPKWFQAIQEGELLVTYVPKHNLPGGAIGISHGFHYVITPKGTLGKYYAARSNMYMTKPEPEILFGKLVWDGELRVQVNPNPKF